MKRFKTSEAVKMGLSGTFRKFFSLPKLLVTNEDVRSKFLKGVFESGSISSSNMKLIEKLVDNQRIVPVECTADLIKQLNKNLSGDACKNPKDYEYVLGFYTGKQNRLYILMDNIERLMKNNRKGLFNVTIHELQHMCCYNFMRDFMTTWYKELCEFYSTFFVHLYKSHGGSGGFFGGDKKIINNIMNPDNGIAYYVQYLLYNCEYLYCCAGATITSKDCMLLGDKCEQILKNCGVSDNIAYKCGKSISTMMYNVLSGSITRTFRGDDSNTIMCFRKAYMDVFGRDPWKNNTFIYQEIIFPSEVICIISEFYPNDQRLFKFLNYL